MITRRSIPLFVLLCWAFVLRAGGEHPRNLQFIRNNGQWNEKVLYQSDFRGGRLFLESTAFTYLFYPAKGFSSLHPHEGGKNEPEQKAFQFHAVKMEFAGCASARVLGDNKKEHYYNYFIGNDAARWAAAVPAYENVLYKDLYPGITVRTLSELNNFRYDLIVAPNADPSVIKLKFTGQERLSVKNGHLYLKTSVGEILQQAPFAYQEVNGEKREVPCAYALHNNIVSFSLGNYDPSRELVIDPTLVFSTFTGSTADNWGMSATYDAAGNGYTSGITFGMGYPITTGAFQGNYAGGVVNSTYSYGGFDITVSKFNATGTSLLYSTYLGGSDNEAPQSIVVDNAGNLVVMGRSYSSNYPVTAGAYDVTLNGLNTSDIVVTKFNANGTALLASTFVGGTQDDGVSISAVETFLGSLKYNYADDGRSDVIVDAANNVYVASCTISNNFPVTAGCIQSNNAGMQDACVFKLNAGLTSLLFSTYLGGAQNDAAYNIALDATNNIYVTGGTESANFPTTAGSFKPAYSGAIDGFITHLNNAGTAILQSTYVGTPAYDQSYFIQLDKFGKVYVYGQSAGAYPVTGSVYANANSGQFIHCFDPALATTQFSTVFGTSKGTPDIAPSAFLVDNCENIYISGWGGTLFGYNVATSTTYNLPVTGGAFQTTTDGSDFYFLILQKNASSLLYATYMGGSFSLEHVDGGTSRFDKTGVVYQAICEGCGGYSDLPTTPGAWSSTNNSFNCNNALVKFRFDLVITLAQFTISPNISVGCAPLALTFQNSSTNAVSYTWDFGDGGTSALANPAHTYTTPGTYTVMMIATDTTTCNLHDTAYAVVRVTPNPTVTVSPAGPLCIGQSVQLNATSSTAITYSWTPGTGLSNVNIPNPIASPTVSTQYIVTVADSFCTAKDTVNIAVFPNTIPVITGATSLCSGDSVYLGTTAPFTSYQWSTGQSTPGTWVYTTGIYTLSTLDANGCLGSDTIKINVLPSPVASYSINSATGCAPFLAQFSSTGSGANSFSWDFGDGTGSSTVSPSHTYTLAGTYSVTFIVTDTANCNNPDTAYATITVNPTPTLSIAPPPPYCIGDTVQLSAVSSTAISYTWIPAGGLSNNTIPNPYASPTVTTIYTLNVSNGACTKSDTVTVKVFPKNVTTISATSQLCAGDSVVLTANGPGVSWTWATGQTSQVIVIYAAGSYVVNTVDANGCKGDATIDINVYYPVSISTRDTLICEGWLAPIRVNVAPAGNYTYNWNPQTGLSNAYVANPIANPALSTQYTVAVANGPCVTTDTLNVDVLPLPKVTVTPRYSEIFYGESVTLTAVSNYPITWVPYDYLSCVNCYITTATPEKNMTYHAIAVNELGCQSMDTARIEIEPSFYVPNSFTPNGDVHNEFFKPIFGGYIAIDVWIYDRWGNEITHWTDLDGSWDGTFKGKPVQEDVYVYLIKATDFRKKVLSKSGTVTVIR
jgi:gliding motility-associated-like protein